MAAGRDRSGQAVRTKLAANGPRAAEIEGLLFTGRQFRSSFDRLASTRCDSPEKNSQRLHRPTSRSAEKCFDVSGARRRFHASRTCACENAWLPPDHARSNYSASGNSRDVLSKRSFLRTDVTITFCRSATLPAPN